jgi:hypothetical protein
MSVRIARKSRGPGLNPRGDVAPGDVAPGLSAGPACDEPLPPHPERTAMVAVPTTAATILAGPRRRTMRGL